MDTQKAKSIRPNTAARNAKKSKWERQGYLTLKAIEDNYPLKRMTIMKRVKEGTFPQPLAFSTQPYYFDPEQIDEYFNGVRK